MKTTSLILMYVIACTALIILFGLSGCDTGTLQNNDAGATEIPGEMSINPGSGNGDDDSGFDTIRASSTPVKVTKDGNMDGPSKIYYSSVRTMYDYWSDGSTQVTDSISSIHVYPGWEVIIYRYTDYKGDYKVLGENSSSSNYWLLKNITMSGDLNWNNRVSSMEIRKKIVVPSKLEYIKSDPSNSEFGDEVYVNDVQGIAHSTMYWFICNMTRIYRCEKDKITNSLQSTKASSLPSAIDDYNHFGDLDYHDGYLYAPIYNRDSSSKVSALVVYDTALNFIKYAYFPKDIQTSVAWVSINPVNDLIYSTSDYRKLRVYDNKFSNGATLTYLFSVDLDFGNLGHSDGSWWNHVMNQGGEFGPDGLFYYVLDHKSDEDSKYTGFYIFKINGRKGTAKWRANIQYDPDRGDGWKRNNELEGITVWDRGNGKYPGQVHILYIDLEAGEDDCWLMHYATK